MGKFNDTKYVNTIDNLVDATKNKLNNPYYAFADQKPTKVIYYAQNIEKSTIDEASGLYDKYIGPDSPFKFNRIEDFFMYGIEKIQTQYDLGDNGIESEPIAGSATILPNSITPRPGDHFQIPYIKEGLIFKINEVSADTLDSGANIYRVGYELCGTTTTIEAVEKQVVKNFNFVVNNAGTDFKTVIESCDYKLADELAALVENLITYFENIFFDSKLQTFVYNHDGWHMYDPYIIEFFKRNKVLNYGSKYIFIDHATIVDKTFGMDYTKTFFYSLENPDQEPRINTMCTADLIQDPNSLFATRMEHYYGVNYNDKTPYKTRFEVIDTEVVERIKSNKYFSKGDPKEIYNLWIAYFNKDKNFIKGDVIGLIKEAEYMDNLHWFYTLAISIFIIEQSILNLMR